jgi:hypothetical protein
VHGVILDTNLADVPALRAQLDVLLLLAEAVHHHRLDLLSAARAHIARRQRDRRTWIHYVDVLATTFADPEQIAYVQSGSDASRLLMRAADSGVVRTSELEVTGVFDRMRSRIEDRVHSGEDPVMYLGQANTQAHGAILGWLDTHRVVSDLPPQPAGLRLVYSDSPGGSCAVSSTTLQEIVWTVGPTDVAFWCAIQAESVLKHEYLSHFAPRHPELSANVREGWLMDVLVDDMNRHGSASRMFDVGSFIYLRSRIADPRLYHSSAGARDLPHWIRRLNADLYWDLTRAIIGLRPDEVDRIDRVDSVLDALLALPADELERRMHEAKWLGFKDFQDAIASWR